MKESKRLVVQVVAVHATPDPEGSWPVQMYGDKGWLPYRAANARYYATDIGRPDLGRSQEKKPYVRDYVDEALAGLPADIPLIVFVDAEACNGFWSGLTHPRFGEGVLPGSNLRHPDLAVVRCASGARVPRPSHQDHNRRVRDAGQPAMPRTELYEHEENGVRSWLLAQTSRVHRSGAEGRAGTYYTRWTLPDSRERWMNKDWHALTAIEIAVAQPGSWQPEELAALTARLCNQAASWDDRTRLPTPLHLAKCSDEDHPGNPPDDHGEGLE